MQNAATLEVDLTALRNNYRLLKDRHARCNIAAVVKANAYGLGMGGVAPALWVEGCTQFFVATLAEGIELRDLLPQAEIAVFNGTYKGEEHEYIAHRLVPVLGEATQIERWERTDAPAILHVDTGMTRLGLDQGGLQHIIDRYPQFAAKNIAMLMSHLACANEPEHPKNTEQLKRFNQAAALLPNIPCSLSNSSGLFLSTNFHFQLGRPGCALYGINPTESANPMHPVARLSAPIIQLRNLAQQETVGYGATCALPKGSRIAIAGLGYADGWFRSLSNRGFSYVNNHKVPIIGRISMDMLALDVSTIPEMQITPATRVELINRQQTVDDVAAACGTIGYEIFTRLGRRVKRVHTPL